MIHLAAAPRGEEKGGGGGMAAMAGWQEWQGAQEEAKQSPSVGPSLGGGAVAARWRGRWSVAAAAVRAMCVCGMRSGITVNRCRVVQIGMDRGGGEGTD